jgi:hypothetical protein
MLLNILTSNVSYDASYVSPGAFEPYTPNSRYFKVFNTELIDWLSFRQTTQNGGVPVTTFNALEDGVYQPFSTFSSSGSIATAAGANPVGIQSYAPNIYVNANVSLGHSWNMQTNSSDSGMYSNSFLSYNQALDNTGVNIVPASWSLDIIQSVPGTSLSLGTGPNAPNSLSAPFTWTIGSTTGLFIFQVNATSVDGLTTNQTFFWNLFT